MHHSAPKLPPTGAEPAYCVVIIGLGPRGASLMERIAARAPDSLRVHMVDDAAPGAGRIWRTDQDPDMCMNTLAGAVTLFTDASFTGAGPRVEGPSLLQWCQLVAEFAAGEQWEGVHVAGRPRQFFDAGASFDAILRDPAVRAEVSGVHAGSHPSRALYGHYCRWVMETSLQRLGSGVQVITHPTRAVAISVQDGGRTLVELADGTSVLADSVALSPGWLPSEPNDADLALQRRIHGRDLLWIRPESPIHQDLSGIRPGETVIVRGLGMGFFDSLSMLTIGRGGRFEELPGNRLRYVASGEEPVVHVGSRRGLPFLAKSVYQGLPPAPRLRRVREAERAGLSSPLRFRDEIWPHLIRDANEAFYLTLARRTPLDMARILAEIDLADVESLPQRLGRLLPEHIKTFDLPALFSFRMGASTANQYGARVRELVEADLTEAEAGLASPLKAALWEVNGARRFSVLNAAFDGADDDGYNGDLAEFLSFGGMIGSGPPAFRSRQLLALLDAGLVHFMGPDVTVEADKNGFTAHSPVITGSAISSRVLLDAWVRLHDARRTRDPLVRQLLASGLAEPFARRNASGSRTPGASLRIDESTSELIGPAGRHGIHFLGVPSDVARGDTIIAPMPGSDPTMLREVDACVEAMLERRAPAHWKA